MMKIGRTVEVLARTRAQSFPGFPIEPITVQNAADRSAKLTVLLLR